VTRLAAGNAGPITSSLRISRRLKRTRPMLNMLPKFELVPISRYFITLPKAPTFEDAA